MSFEVGRIGTVKRCFELRGGAWTVEVRSGSDTITVKHTEELNVGSSITLLGRPGSYSVKPKA